MSLHCKTLYFGFVVSGLVTERKENNTDSYHIGLIQIDSFNTVLVEVRQENETERFMACNLSYCPGSLFNKVIALLYYCRLFENFFCSLDYVTLFSFNCATYAW